MIHGVRYEVHNKQSEVECHLSNTDQPDYGRSNLFDSDCSLKNSNNKKILLPSESLQMSLACTTCGIWFISNLSEDVRGGFDFLCLGPVHKKSAVMSLIQLLIHTSRSFYSKKLPSCYLLQDERARRIGKVPGLSASMVGRKNMSTQLHRAT
ncbi:uncharacterized protein LOC144582184 isoform X1 [Callithrix jacchus]